ncbi:hypothetical protein GJAV_G00259670 [Gymnothorax javanicus]|nr:hypothetical protein GJAV_G00259670 [Gymnothorax javanicus]
MDQVRRSVGEALWGMCAADAMSMPVHWYYCVQDIKKDFGGWIASFQSPRNRHPSSILTLSNTAGSGRTMSSLSQRPPVVGTIILHDKLKLWKLPRGSVHYHQGLPAGANTLNTQCALRVLRTLTADGSVGLGNVAEQRARASVLADYVSFMSTPGSHDDTYAESFHRAFFSDWQEERPSSPSEVLEFAERRYKENASVLSADGQLNAIGCLPMAIPFILLSAQASEDQAVGAAVEFVRLTHPMVSLGECVSLYARVLHAALRGSVYFPDVLGSEERLKVHQRAVAELGLACYIKGALSSLFYLAHEFHDDLPGGILANTNCGGENCNRGAALGALLGARAGHVGGAIPEEWKDGLEKAAEIRAALQSIR